MVKVGMNAVPSTAISAIWRSQASKSAFFLSERTFTGRKDIFYPWDTTSESEFGQNNDRTRNTGAAAKLKGPTDFYRGAGIFTVPTTLTLHFNPCC